MGANPIKRRIVVADDTEFWREKILALLATTGHDVIAVGNGATAARLCLDPARPADLLVLDLVMPDTDGFETARYLRSEPITRNLPIIAITSFFNKQDFPRGLREQGFDAIVEKTAGPDQCLFVFNKYLNPDQSKKGHAPRVPARIPTMFCDANSQRRRGLITNLSVSGAFVSTLEPLAQTAQVQIAFELPDGTPISTTATVVWVNDERAAARTSYSLGNGLTFKEMSGDDSHALLRFIQQELLFI